MAIILEERGYSASDSRQSARASNAPKMLLYAVAGACSTMNRILLMLNPFWRQPAKPEAFSFIFAQVHCELNFIEQCWGYSKESIDSVQFHPKRSTWSACSHGARLRAAGIYAPVCNPIAVLHGWLPAGFEWETGRVGLKKIPGHRVLPDTIFQEIELDLVD